MDDDALKLAHMVTAMGLMLIAVLLQTMLVSLKKPTSNRDSDSHDDDNSDDDVVDDADHGHYEDGGDDDAGDGWRWWPWLEMMGVGGQYRRLFCSDLGCDAIQLQLQRCSHVESRDDAPRRGWRRALRHLRTETPTQITMLLMNWFEVRASPTSSS